MKIYLKKKLVDLDGKEVQKSKDDSSGATIGTLLSTLLVAPGKRQFDTLKAFEMALKCYNDTELEVDQSDLVKLKAMINENQDMSGLLLGQVLAYLEGLKEEKKEAEKPQA